MRILIGLVLVLTILNSAVLITKYIERHMPKEEPPPKNPLGYYSTKSGMSDGPRSGIVMCQFSGDDSAPEFCVSKM